MMEQVWINLISNAFKYSQKKEKPIIEIGLFKNKEEIVYFVKGKGAGFDMDYSHTLFSAFKRPYNKQSLK